MQFPPCRYRPYVACARTAVRASCKGTGLPPARSLRRTHPVPAAAQHPLQPRHGCMVTSRCICQFPPCRYRPYVACARTAVQASCKGTGLLPARSLRRTPPVPAAAQHPLQPRHGCMVTSRCMCQFPPCRYRPYVACARTAVPASCKGTGLLPARSLRRTHPVPAAAQHPLRPRHGCMVTGRDMLQFPPCRYRRDGAYAGMAGCMMTDLGIL